MTMGDFSIGLAMEDYIPVQFNSVSKHGDFPRRSVELAEGSSGLYPHFLVQFCEPTSYDSMGRVPTMTDMVLVAMGFGDLILVTPTGPTGTPTGQSDFKNSGIVKRSRSRKIQFVQKE